MRYGGRSIFLGGTVKRFVGLLAGIILNSSAFAAPAQLTHQGRLLDASGAPVTADMALKVELFADGGSNPLWSRSFASVPVSGGYYALALSGADDEGVLLDDVLATGLAAEVAIVELSGGGIAVRQALGHTPRAAVAERAAGAVVVAVVAGDACADAGALAWSSTESLLLACDGVEWAAVRAAEPDPAILVALGTGRRWSDGTYARSCKEYLVPAGGYAYDGLVGDGRYTISPNGVPFEVECDMSDGGWTRIAINDFEQTGPTGWSDNGTYVCAGDTVHGGYGNTPWTLGNEVFRTFDLTGLVHTQARYVANLHFMDSWDNELGLIFFDGVEVYRKSWHFNNSPSNRCGNTGYADYTERVDFTASHSAETLQVLFDNTLNGTDAANETFGVGEYELWVR